MALNKITYDNKQTLIDQPSIAEINKCTASNMNEIKSVVNDAIDQVDTNTSDIGNMTTSINGALQSLSNIMDYSATEKVVGNWIDGKPLYRRVLEDTLGTTNAGWKSIQLTSSNYIKKVISITAMFEYSNGNNYSIPFFRGTDDNYTNREYCLCNINPANGEFAIIARHPSNYALMSGQTFYAIILYTKSSDYS